MHVHVHVHARTCMFHGFSGAGEGSAHAVHFTGHVASERLRSATIPETPGQQRQHPRLYLRQGVQGARKLPSRGQCASPGAYKVRACWVAPVLS